MCMSSRKPVWLVRMEFSIAQLDANRGICRLNSESVSATENINDIAADGTLLVSTYMYMYLTPYKTQCLVLEV